MVVVRSVMGLVRLPRTIGRFDATVVDIIFIGKILRSAMMPFCHGSSKSIITSVLHALFVLKVNNFLLSINVEFESVR